MLSCFVSFSLPVHEISFTPTTNLRNFAFSILLFRYLDGNEISPTCIWFSQCQGLYLICKELSRDGKLVWWRCIMNYETGPNFPRKVKLITFWWICWPVHGLSEWVSCSTYHLTSTRSSTTLHSRSKEFVYWFKSWNLFERGFLFFSLF